MDNINEKWINQLKKGLFELCILLILKKGDTYGYEITRILNQMSLFSVSEGSIYPILKRLVTYDFITAYWVENEGGPPRKYYKLKKRGEILIEERFDTFQNLFKSVLKIKEGIYYEK